MARSRSRSKSRKHKQKKVHKHKPESSDRSSSSCKKPKLSQKKKSAESVKSDAGHYNYRVGQHFKKGKYEVTKFLSDGTFGRVVEVKNLNDNKFYAMKIIRAVERYVDSARTEEYILKYLEARDHHKDSKVVKFFEAFERKKNYCMVFERLGLSLYEILKKNDFVGFPMRMVQSFFRQILKAIGFMHSLQLTHTDLKPENILVCSTELVKTKIRVQRSQSNSTTERSESEEQYRKIYLPVSDEIKLIDMGGATFDYEHHSAVINTRQYRAPEVILGCTKWNSSSDIWGLACIVIELYTGELFFQTRKSDYEHLAMIEKTCGPIPQWMVNRTSPPLDKYFNTSERQFEKYHSYFTWPQTGATGENLERIRKMKSIEQTVNNPQLSDLLKRMLQIDPQHRITCDNALRHPFFRQTYE